jgi:hypothetical protein
VGLTPEEYQQLLRHAPKPSKYRNTRVTINGETFDSKKEAAYYCELLLREKAGEVRNIQRQMTFHLCAPIVDAMMRQEAIPKIVYVASYVADMTFEEKSLVGNEAPAGCDHKFVDSNNCLKCGWIPLWQWNKVVVDVKGAKNTAMFSLKSKWLFLQSGIRVREVR